MCVVGHPVDCLCLLPLHRELRKQQQQQQAAAASRSSSSSSSSSKVMVVLAAKQQLLALNLQGHVLWSDNTAHAHSVRQIQQLTSKT